MSENELDEEKGPPVSAPRRGPGHRGADMRDTVAEMAERAQLISQEAGSKVSSAMKDVISAAAGLAGFAIESARDLVQYMVRRGQMTQEEADKLIRAAEDAYDKKPAIEKARPTASKIAADKAAVDRAAREAANAAAMLNAPPQRSGAFSLRTGAPRPAAKPAEIPDIPDIPALAELEPPLLPDEGEEDDVIVLTELETPVPVAPALAKAPRVAAPAKTSPAKSTAPKDSPAKDSPAKERVAKKTAAKSASEPKSDPKEAAKTATKAPAKKK